MPDTTLLYAIGALDIALYAFLIAGFSFARRKPTFNKIASLPEAFGYLEKRLRLAFPDLREGFTWKEAMTRVRPLYAGEDWILVDGVLQKYQAYRYGGVDPGNDVQIDSIVKLAMTLPKSGGRRRGK